MTYELAATYGALTVDAWLVLTAAAAVGGLMWWTNNAREREITRLRMQVRRLNIEREQAERVAAEAVHVAVSDDASEAARRQEIRELNGLLWAPPAPQGDHP